MRALPVQACRGDDRGVATAGVPALLARRPPGRRLGPDTPTAAPPVAPPPPRRTRPGTTRPRAARRKQKAKEAKARAAAAEGWRPKQQQQAEDDAHDAAALVAASKALAKAKADLVVAQTALQGRAGPSSSRPRPPTRRRRPSSRPRCSPNSAPPVTSRAVESAHRCPRAGPRPAGPLGVPDQRRRWASGRSCCPPPRPNQLADRLAFLQSVGSAGNACSPPRGGPGRPRSTPRPP